MDDVSLHVPSGSTLGILGATGSAKTSFVQLIPRLYDVTSGSVKVAGKDVKNYDLKTLRDNVAMVLQKNVLFSGTIKENMRWGNDDATDEEIIEACKLAQADEFITKCLINTTHILNKEVQTYPVDKDNVYVLPVLY